MFFHFFPRLSAKRSKKINKTKNTPFHARNRNEPLKRMTFEQLTSTVRLEADHSNRLIEKAREAGTYQVFVETLDHRAKKLGYGRVRFAVIQKQASERAVEDRGYGLVREKGDRRFLGEPLRKI